jgi:hypothetical protein
MTRVMVLVKATEDSEKGFRPTPEVMEEMGRFNDELRKAGILRAADGLTPSSKGKRVVFDGPGRTVIDGPFAETKELIAGFWLRPELRKPFLCTILASTKGAGGCTMPAVTRYSRSLSQTGNV